MRILILIIILFASLFAGGIAFAHDQEALDVSYEILNTLHAMMGTEHPPAFTPSEETCTGLVFTDVVTIDSVKALLEQVGPCIKAGHATTLLINSGGGDIYAATYFYDMVALYGDRSLLHTIATGQVASAAVTMFLAGENRSMARYGTILIHPGFTFWEGKLSGDDRHELNLNSETASDIYAEIISEKTGLSRSDVDERVNKRSIFRASEAVALGFAHQVFSK